MARWYHSFNLEGWREDSVTPQVIDVCQMYEDAKELLGAYRPNELTFSENNCSSCSEVIPSP